MTPLRDSILAMPRYRIGLDSLGRPAPIRDDTAGWVWINQVLDRVDAAEDSAKSAPGVPRERPSDAAVLVDISVAAGYTIGERIVEAARVVRRFVTGARPRGTGT